jgi:REP element-mobilizing transposase RayT
MHCLWTLPQGDADFSGRWRAIKTAFAKSLPAVEPRSEVMTRRGERGIWQRRYWEHTIRDDRDFAIHFDYIHTSTRLSMVSSDTRQIAAFNVSPLRGQRALPGRLD